MDFVQLETVLSVFSTYSSQRDNLLMSHYNLWLDKKKKLNQLKM